MTVFAGMTIKCNPDGSEAVIGSFPAFDANSVELSLGDYMTFLAENNVVKHINTNTLANALQQALESGHPVQDVIAASARLSHEIILCSNDKPTSQQIVDFVNNLRNVYRVIYDLCDVSVTGISAVFVTGGQEILSVNTADSNDIYNRKINTRPIPFELKAGTNTIFEKTNDGFKFIAEKSGYLAVCPDEQLHVIAPLQVSDDKMKVVLNLLPVHEDQDVGMVLDAACEQFSGETMVEQRCLKPADLKDKISYFYTVSGCSPVFLTVAKGTPAVDASPCRVNLFVQLDNKPDDDGVDRVNYADFSSYCMVKQDQKIAEVFKAAPGVPGKDVTGQVIEPGKSEQSQIVIGERIQTQEFEDKQVLVASDNGCLIYGDNKISVTDSIIIPGNVGPETGRIEKGPSSVIIKGNILSGYSVECEKTLIVEGSVEAGAKVRCHDLTVYKGVFGHKSDILVTGDAEIGYIQAATLRVLGNLSVVRYIMESEITCRGNLSVEGRGVSGKERGAVIGGNLSILGNAYLHSVGSVSDHTNILCGIDTQIYDKIKLCKTAISAFNTEAAKIQKSIGFNLADPDAVEKLKSMPAYRKDEISAKLVQVKEILTKAALYEEQCKVAQLKAFAPDLKTVRINIENHIVPMAHFSIGEIREDITDRLSHVSLRIADDQLTIEPLR